MPGQRRGAAESVTVDLPWLAVALKALAVNRLASDSVIDMNMTTFRRLFREAMIAFNCSDWGFTPYSLRRGGATEMWRQTGALSRVTLRGRWAHASTARIYVNDGLATLAELRLPLQPQEALNTAWMSRTRAIPCLFLTDDLARGPLRSYRGGGGSRAPLLALLWRFQLAGCECARGFWAGHALLCRAALGLIASTCSVLPGKW